MTYKLEVVMTTITCTIQSNVVAGDFTRVLWRMKRLWYKGHKGRRVGGEDHTHYGYSYPEIN